MIRGGRTQPGTDGSGEADENLGERDVHVWLADPGMAIANPGAIRGYVSLLDREEMQRYRSFRFDRDRYCFLVAHVLLRTTLSRYAPVGPADWVFNRNAFGRPEIAGPSHACSLRFNLSHTNGLVACAITKSADIGIDVEELSRQSFSLDVSSRFFAREEHDMICRAPVDQQQELFCAVWTLKEAYIKARGLGLTIPLDGFAFELHDLDIRVVRFREGLDDNPAPWQFVVQRTGPRHMLALAIRGRESVDMVPHIRRAGPTLWPADRSAMSD